MTKFKIGDRVKGNSNYSFDPIKEGIIKNVDLCGVYSVEVIIGNSESQREHWEGTIWRYREENLELITPRPQHLTNTIITNIKDEAQHKRVQEKLFKMGNTRIGCRRCKFDGGIKVYDDGLIDNLNGYDEPNFKHITASEFLWEETTISGINKAVDEVVNVSPPQKSMSWEPSWFTEDYIKKFKNYNMPEVDSCVDKGDNKIMSNIVSFFNDLTVSSEDKELRKAGLKNDNFDWTSEALEIVKNLEAKELGYKNYQNMVKENHSGEGLSAMEANALFAKFYVKLLETAKAFNKKEEKK